MKMASKYTYLALIGAASAATECASSSDCDAAGGEACAAIYTNGEYTASTCGPANYCGTATTVGDDYVEVVCLEEEDAAEEAEEVEWEEEAEEEEAEDDTVILEYSALDWSLACERDEECYRGESCGDIYIDYGGLADPDYSASVCIPSEYCATTFQTDASAVYQAKCGEDREGDEVVESEDD